MIFADMVWPAVYITSSIYKFWFIVFITIIVEAFCIKYFLVVSFKKSLLISAVGNVISGFAGTSIFMVLMLLIDAFIEYLTGSSFTIFDWVISYFVLCFGSILLEILVIKLIWKFDFKRLIIPLSVGNILTYLIIFYLNNFNIFYKGL